MPSQTMEFESLLEAVPDALVGVDKSGVIRFVNHRAESLFGYGRDDLVGMSVEKLVPESLRMVHKVHRQSYNAAPRTRSMGSNLKLSGLRRDGTEFPVDISLSARDDADSLLVIAAVRDMTHYRLSEQDRRLDRLSAAVEFSGEAITSATLDGIITSWNPAAERLFGYSSKEMIGKPIQPVTPGDRPDEMLTVTDRIRAGEVVESFETVRVRKDGTKFPVSLNIAPIHDGGPSGTIVGMSVIARDVTTQKQAIERAERMAAIVEQSQDAIISTSLDGNITSWNPASEGMFGYSSEEIIGRSGRLLGPKSRAHEILDILRKIGNGQTFQRIETTQFRRDGTEFPVSLTASPIRDADGTIVSASWMIRDLTEQQRTFESARSMIETSLDSFVVISPEGKITDANEATVRATGVPRDKLIGTSFSDYFTNPGKAEEIYQQVFEQGGVTDYPLTLLHRDGRATLTEVLYNASVFRDPAGNVLGVFAAARDVTKQIRAQKEIAERRARELERLAELERFQRLTVGRELKMIELKKELEYLKKYGPHNGGEPGDHH